MKFYGSNKSVLNETVDQGQYCFFPYVHIHINRTKGSNCLLDTM